MTETPTWAILELALQKSGQSFDLAPSRFNRLHGREAGQLRELGDDGNIMWASQIHPQHDEMRPIAIPFTRNLISYRYLWVRTADVDRFSEISTIDDLREYSILTGQNWGANYILEAQGLDLRKGYSANLPRMLIGKRGDILLWPVFGLYNMLDAYGGAELEMTPVPGVLVKLPQAVYFWVADEGSQDLYDAVEFGLQTAINDGSLDTLIQSFPRIGQAYTDLLSNEYRIITVDNSSMSDQLLKDLDMYGITIADGG